MQVNLAVFLHIETGAGFDVGQILRIGQFQSKKLTDLTSVGFCRTHQIDPDRLDSFQVLDRFDRGLAQAAIRQLKGVHDACGAQVAAAGSQRVASGIADFVQNVVGVAVVDLSPRQKQILGGQLVQNRCNFGGIKPVQIEMQFRQALFLRNRFRLLMTRRILPVAGLVPKPVSGKHILNCFKRHPAPVPRRLTFRES